MSEPAPVQKLEPKKRIGLKAAEAHAKDVGRGFARLDPKDMERLDVNVGDIIELEGKAKTVAKVMPAYAEESGKDIIQMDGIIRQNAKVSLDEKVYIKNLKAMEGRQTVIITVPDDKGLNEKRKYLYYLLSLNAIFYFYYIYVNGIPELLNFNVNNIKNTNFADYNLIFIGDERLINIKKLPENNKKRELLTKHYIRLLKDNSNIIIPFKNHTSISACHLFVILLISEKISRNEFMRVFKNKKIQTSIHYPPIHMFSYHKEYLNCKKLLLKSFYPISVSPQKCFMSVTVLISLSISKKKNLSSFHFLRLRMKNSRTL